MNKVFRLSIVMIFGVMVSAGATAQSLFDEFATNPIGTRFTIDGPNTSRNSVGQPVSVQVTLSWTDTENLRLIQKNDPDTFQMRLTPPNGSALSPSDSSDSGSISMTRTVEENETEAHWGVWTLEVDCVQTGPISTRGPFGILQWTDPGESWEARVTVTYLTEEEK